MARAADDVQQLNLMISPGAALIAESVLFVIMPLLGIASVRAELLLVPLLFLVSFVLALRGYSRALNPVSGALRGQFGAMNARLAEAISGIEVVKGYAQSQRSASGLPRARAATATCSCARAGSRRATCRCCCSGSCLAWALATRCCCLCAAR